MKYVFVVYSLRLKLSFFGPEVNCLYFKSRVKSKLMDHRHQQTHKNTQSSHKSSNHRLIE